MAIQAASVQETYEEMKKALANVVPDVELRIKAELAYEINRLKAEKNAVILGHNYMEPALFKSVPDIVGDSLYLSRMAAQTDKDIIVFCGVEFMAETAKMLNPDKMVLIPSDKAGCSLAASITAAGCALAQSPLPRRPGRHLRQHLRRRQGRKRHLLHLRQCRRGRQLLRLRHHHLPARRISRQERGQRNRQAHHHPLAHVQRRAWKASTAVST